MVASLFLLARTYLIRCGCCAGGAGAEGPSGQQLPGPADRLPVCAWAWSGPSVGSPRKSHHQVIEFFLLKRNYASVLNVLQTTLF